jgi:hypothetical protein
VVVDDDDSPRYTSPFAVPQNALLDHAASVTERLVAPLLRGLAVDGSYLPYAKS